MPNYSYECQDCQNIFEIRVSIKDMEKREFTCNKCGSSNTRRLFNGFSYCGNSSSYKGNAGGCSSCHGGNCSACKH